MKHMSVQVTKRLFTVSEYHRLIEAGILSEDDRVELIDGEIIEMTPIGSHHSGRVNRLNALFGSSLGQRVIISIQNPIQLDDHSEPQPDLSLLKLRADFYIDAHPTPTDVLLVIEVAETSVEIDREVKLPKYAESLIPEAWIVNIPGDVLEVYIRPQNGVYQEKQYLRRGQTLTLQSMPDIRLNVNDILC